MKETGKSTELPQPSPPPIDPVEFRQSVRAQQGPSPMSRPPQQLSQGLSRLLDGHVGRHGLSDEPQKYITLPDLKKYWTDGKIVSAFNCIQGLANAPLEVPDRIRSNFLRVFSLLVWIDELREIAESFMESGLTDDKFPLLQFPSCWHETPSSRDLYNKIAEEQWKFFPFMINTSDLYNQRLGKRHIIPISKVERIHKSPEATVDRIYVDPSCVTNIDSQHNEPVVFVRKKYVGDAHQAVFSRERRAYEALRQYRSPHIVAYYGAFSQIQGNGKTAYNLILQHVEGDNLECFFNQVKPPRNKRELVQLWSSLTGALKATTIAQQATKQSANSEVNVHIVHQDIKPSNFIVHRKPGAEVHDFSVIMIDFGYSFTGVSIPDDHRNSGAPESSHHEDFTQNDSNEITAAVDVWSLGCVLSEICVWLAGGEEALHAYERRRTREIKGHASLISAGHAGCFHNGYERLQAIDKTHEEVKGSLPSYDDITPCVIRMVEEEMLRPKGIDRQTPYALYEHLQSLISPLLTQQDHASVDTFIIDSLTSNGESKPIKIEPPPRRTQVATQSPRVVNKPATATTPTHAGTTNGTVADDSPRLKITYKEAKEYVLCMKSKQTPNARVAENVQTLDANLKERDIFYFVDTSPTMREHQKKARKALRTYGYLTKRFDRDGLEVSFSSSPRSVLRSRDSTPLVTIFDQQEWGQVAFEDRFSEFLNHHIIPRLPLPRKIGPFEMRSPQRKRISIIVLTDGRWGHDTDNKACGIERPIEDLIRKMTENGVQISRTQISIQFMRFGMDEHGIRHLKYLDNLGKGRDMDFIDTKPYNWDVVAMLLGPIHPGMDEEDEAPRSPKRITNEDLNGSPSRIH